MSSITYIIDIIPPKFIRVLHYYFLMKIILFKNHYRIFDILIENFEPLPVIFSVLYIYYSFHSILIVPFLLWEHSKCSPPGHINKALKFSSPKAHHITLFNDTIIARLKAFWKVFIDMVILFNSFNAS